MYIGLEGDVDQEVALGRLGMSELNLEPVGEGWSVRAGTRRDLDFTLPKPGDWGIGRLRIAPRKHVVANAEHPALAVSVICQYQLPSRAYCVLNCPSEGRA